MVIQKNDMKGMENISRFVTAAAAVAAAFFLSASCAKDKTIRETREFVGSIDLEISGLTPP